MQCKGLWAYCQQLLQSMFRMSSYLQPRLASEASLPSHLMQFFIHLPTSGPLNLTITYNCIKRHILRLIDRVSLAKYPPTNMQVLISPLLALLRNSLPPPFLADPSQTPPSPPSLFRMVWRPLVGEGTPAQLFSGGHGEGTQPLPLGSAVPPLQ